MSTDWAFLLQKNDHPFIENDLDRRIGISHLQSLILLLEVTLSGAVLYRTLCRMLGFARRRTARRLFVYTYVHHYLDTK